MQIVSFLAVAGQWDGSTIGDSVADVQPDGSVDLIDFAALAAEWLLDGFAE